MVEHDEILSDAEREALAMVSAPPAGPQLVLVVDDDKANREALCDYLTACQIDCIMADSSVTAQAKLRSEPRIGLMITDLRMQPEDGLELIKQIRASARADLPIIVVSGDSEVPEAVKAMHLGVLDFLVKPLDAGKLLQLLDWVRKELRV